MNYKIGEKLIISLVGVLIFAMNSSAQYDSFANLNKEKPFPWKEGKRCAVSLTFDDARLSQVDVGMDLFKKHNVRATFYVIPSRMEQRMDEWKQMIQHGHELGNHTVSHPCSGNFEFTRGNALENYTLDQIENELDEANQRIMDRFGVAMTSFAYPCGHSFVGRGTEVKSYVPIVAELFTSGRGWMGEDSNDPWFCDMAQLQGMESDGKPFDEILERVRKAEREGRWLILAGHEIGEGGRQTTLVSTLEKLFDYANDDKNGIWLDTVGNVSEHILEMRGKE